MRSSTSAPLVRGHGGIALYSANSRGAGVDPGVDEVVAVPRIIVDLSSHFRKTSRSSVSCGGRLPI